MPLSVVPLLAKQGDPGVVHDERHDPPDDAPAGELAMERSLGFLRERLSD